MVQYDDQAPWPEAADGRGPSLQLLAHDLDNNLYSSWFVANGILFSPGSANGGNSTEESHLHPAGNIHIYPNPMGEVLFMEINEEPGARIEMGIYTLSGTRIRNIMFQTGSSPEITSWHHQIEQPGAYILRAVIQHPGHRREESHLLIFSGKR